MFLKGFGVKFEENQQFPRFKYSDFEDDKRMQEMIASLELRFDELRIADDGSNYEMQDEVKKEMVQALEILN